MTTIESQQTTRNAVWSQHGRQETKAVPAIQIHTPPIFRTALRFRRNDGESGVGKSHRNKQALAPARGLDNTPTESTKGPRLRGVRGYAALDSGRGSGGVLLASMSFALSAALTG